MFLFVSTQRVDEVSGMRQIGFGVVGVRAQPTWYHILQRARVRSGSANILPQVLSRHYDVICSTEAAEAFRIAEANVEILLARAKLSRSESDKNALNEARRNRVRMIVSHFNLRCVMNSSYEYLCCCVVEVLVRVSFIRKRLLSFSLARDGLLTLF